MNHIAEITRLRALEYSDVAEWLVRLTGIAAGSVMLAVYTENPWGLLWIASYGAAHLAYYLFMRSRVGTASLRDVRIAQSLFLLVLASFVLGPVWMVIQDDRALNLVGTGLFGCSLVYLIRRNEVFLFAVLGQIGVMSLSMAFVAYHVLPELGSPIAQGGMVMSWLALVGFFAQSIWQSRKLTLAEKGAKDEVAQSQKLAAIGQMAGGVAHDFNNNLMVIIGNLELLEDMDDKAERAACLAAAQTATEQAASTVNELLLFARKTPTRPEAIDANAALVTMKVQPLPHCHMIHADKNQLVTAILNLVINACDAMPEGGSLRVGARRIVLAAELHVAGGRVLPAGRYISYEVCDTGHGIAPAIRASVVEPFFTTKPAGKGTGLGLSIVHSIAEHFRGGVQIVSGGTGTTVSILLPQIDISQVVGLGIASP
ncbi:sensor histidine kinase [Pseudosulfitobacter koreensis]|uniref:histidine kinase n=1 Tax=Pseudosulfitobacter koreensis TaxID=2968472 RepID=A0ABT1Z3C2_9RHOB|nr:ATP-binding protein [Pseudosulfitobacter koreense]MCR8827649.1 ATP-binding protein [Pseudosulfitobacter koreense]